ncbi:MAG: PLP-dependent aminotransferase family protein [Clostridia bacterium]|nr:PLP-dependent aminotransferase family protein [Clostridia bacterium]
MTYDFIELDKDSRIPLYQQLYNCISEAIEMGKLPQETKLPSIRGLSEDLGVSRTTVEGAYSQLSIEGYIISKPQSGFYVYTPSLPSASRKPIKPVSERVRNTPEILYDLGSGSIDIESADIKIWRTYVKDVLKQQAAMAAYGTPQGEYELRRELAHYSYTVRGVECSPDSIVIGAGTQQLLYLICGLLRPYGDTIAIEKGGFARAEQVFTDCGYNIAYMSSDCDGMKTDNLCNFETKILFVNPSENLMTGQPMKMSRRYELLRRAADCGGIIIEDDYNGELRYSSRPIPALQGTDSSRVIYIGSFSKLLLPSVRVGYAVLPDVLLCEYKKKSMLYNQAASKVEQLALAKYIHEGQLDKRLRKLRKIYYEKSTALTSALKKHFGDNLRLTVFENSLYIEITLPTAYTDLSAAALEKGLRITELPGSDGSRLRLSFAGILPEDIEPAVELLRKICIGKA